MTAMWKFFKIFVSEFWMKIVSVFRIKNIFQKHGNEPILNERAAPFIIGVFFKFR